MHILLIHQAFVALDEPGGTRHYELASYLAERGHQITVIASRVSYLTGRPENTDTKTEQFKNGGSIEILRAYSYSALHRSFPHRLFSFFSFMFSSFFLGVKLKKLDLVWGTSPPIFQGITALSLARLKRVPFLFEVRDLWPAFAVQVGVLRQPILIHASQWLERTLYRSADQLVVNSPGFLSHVKERGGRNVELVPNGTDIEMFNPEVDGTGFRAAHNLQDKFVVLYAGAHGMSNDLGILLESAKFLSQRTDIYFVLLGDGKEKSNLVALSRELDLKNTLFLPPSPKSQMAQALAGVNACVAILKPVPLYSTVYPNKVFDYMAVGKPVILAIDGVIRSAVEEAGAGIYVQPGDPLALAQAVESLADNPQQARYKGNKGREYVVKHFNRADLADKLNQVITRMVPE